MSEFLPDVSSASVSRSGFTPGQRDIFTSAQTKSSRADSQSLSQEAREELRELKRRDAEVRAHEQAHLAAGGRYAAGGAIYEYQKGPDGRMYAVGGAVEIDASPISGDPRATEEKADQVRRAALAPGEPSAQDRKVAAEADRMKAEARLEQTRNESVEPGAAGLAEISWQNGVYNVGRHKRSGQQFMFSAADENPTEVSPAALSRAASVYSATSLRGVMTTSLAPGGTGISMTI